MKSVEIRKEILKYMHECMIYMNHEGAYETWIINGVPGCPNECDFESIAENEEEFYEVVGLWYRLYTKYRKYGMIN